MRSLRGANSGAVLRMINPIVRRWSAYYRTVVSSEVSTALDNYLWTLTYKWAKHSIANKPKHWVVDRYFGQFNKTSQDRWVFGDRDGGAAEAHRDPRTTAHCASFMRRMTVARAAVGHSSPPSPCQQAAAGGNAGYGRPAGRSAPRSPRPVARWMSFAVVSHT